MLTSTRATFGGRSVDRRLTNQTTSVVPVMPATRPASAAATPSVGATPLSAAHDGRQRAAAELRRVADPAQFAGQVARALPALVGILREARRARCDRAGGVSGCSSTIGGGCVLRIAAIRLAWLFPLERLLPGDHLVEHRAEREDVGARVGLLALDLLRRHVLKRAEDRALAVSGAACVGSVVGAPAPRRPPRRRFREAEVEQLRAGLRQHDVAGLQIAMDDAVPVRLVERVGDLDRDSAAPRSSGSAPFVSRSASVSPSRYSMTRNVDAVLFADVVQRADVRMVELRDRPRLALEALANCASAANAGQDLDRDGAIEPRVARLVDLAHAAGAERRQDLVGAETGAGIERQRESRERSCRSLCAVTSGRR